MARLGTSGDPRPPGRQLAGAAARGAGRSRGLTTRRAAWLAGGTLAAIYLLTLAPGVTFWDAGELVSAAHGLGIPHPPGTPLYVALGRAWIVLAGWVLGSARAMNLLSALATAAAGGLTAWVVAREFTWAREAASKGDAAGAGVLSALCAGLMTSAWANATETEVYAIALLHAMVLLACAQRASAAEGREGTRWTLCIAFLIALVPAVHLSTLVAVPAVIVLASYREVEGWRWERVFALGGALLVAAGTGRMSIAVVAAGIVLVVVAPIASRRTGGAAVEPARMIALLAVAGSALFVMLVRSRQFPALDQGHPASLSALADVVARRQYAVQGMWPRQAPAWLQLANVFQYADWQMALGFGNGIYTSPARVAATTLGVLLAVVGVRATWRGARRLALTFGTLLLCGTLGVVVYLNLKAGASLGGGVIATNIPHEARERDYFFVLGFWAWGVFVAQGALGLVRRQRWPAWVAGAPVLLLLAGNWRTSDRARSESANAARDVGIALLESAPPRAVLFLAGDNDSYPLWYAQQVEGVRPDVQLVTMALLPAEWYRAEVARRTGLTWKNEGSEPLAEWTHEVSAAHLARAAHDAGYPLAASPMLTPRERALLGSGWSLAGVDYVASGVGAGRMEQARVDSAASARWLARRQASPARSAGHPDDASAAMLGLLDCPRLALPGQGTPASRDSLEVSCNFR